MKPQHSFAFIQFIVIPPRRIINSDSAPFLVKLTIFIVLTQEKPMTFSILTAQLVTIVDSECSGICFKK